MNITENIENKKASLRAEIDYAERELERLELQKEKTNKTQGIEKWLGNDFESSSGLTDEFASFSREYKKELIKMTKADFDLVNFSRGHFYHSGFLKNKKTGKFAYFSSNDVRYSQDGWYNNMLIRTAEHDKDYTGGSNDWANWPNFTKQALKLTQ